MTRRARCVSPDHDERRFSIQGKPYPWRFPVQLAAVHQWWRRLVGNQIRFSRDPSPNRYNTWPWQGGCVAQLKGSSYVAVLAEACSSFTPMSFQACTTRSRYLCSSFYADMRNSNGNDDSRTGLTTEMWYASLNTRLLCPIRLTYASYFCVYF